MENNNISTSSMRGLVYDNTKPKNRLRNQITSRVCVSGHLAKTVEDIQQALHQHSGEKPSTSLAIRFLINRVNEMCASNIDIQNLLGLRGKRRPHNRQEARRFLLGLYNEPSELVIDDHGPTESSAVLLLGEWRHTDK